MSKLPGTVDELLHCATPTAWLERAIEELPILLIDHANCEKKAAGTALSLINRYLQHEKLLHKMSRLAREELRHFEQVLAIMKRRGINYRNLSASRYAGQLHQCVSKNEPERLRDSLFVGALIEARSFERFRALQPLLDDELGNFYGSLLKSEERHFRDYIVLAQSLSADAEQAESGLRQLSDLAGREAELILQSDPNFRFHSGMPT